MRYSIDIESNSLLDDSSIDYTSSPYKLKDTFKVWCVVLQNIDTLETHHFILEEVQTKLKDFLKSATCLVQHNGINFDLLALKLYLGLEYTVEPDTYNGNVCEIYDTLVVSKTLNPDRFGGHSLDKWGERLGYSKIDWRAKAIELGLITKQSPKGAEFAQYHPAMVEYCERDVEITTKLYFALEKEKGTWNWGDAISLEKSVAMIITKQEHRGFWLDKELAERNIRELDVLMEERRTRAEPILPPKIPTQAFLKDVTPPATQFLKSGLPNSHITKFVAKHGASIEQASDGYYTTLFGAKYKLPIISEPLIKEVAATLNDSTHIKDWLVGLGWVPSEYKEKDLSVKTKKIKRTQEEFEKAVDDYVEQTLNCNFKEDRCEILETTPSGLKAKLMRTKEGGSCKVPTNPSFTKGQEKEICPNLEAMGEDFPYAKDIVEYLTYKHRRNSILGGGLEWDEEEDAEKGYLSYVRADGRVPTPADTCGAATSRFKHRKVANIPRNSSLYGENMRSMFGVEKDYFQIGYDFDSLEAKMESSYCWRYDKSKEYCNSLTLDKPLDVHTQMAKKISEIIKKEFNRTPAKSVKYAATYGATEKKIAKTIGADLNTGAQVFNAFWLAALPLKSLKDNLKTYWETTGGKKFILGIDGRKVPTRSAHAILNSLFQSAGVICAKRAMVIHDNLLQEAGLRVDFFVDDWKSKSFCQQMMAYHDEAQLEVTKDLVKFKALPIKLTETMSEDEIEVLHKRLKMEMGEVKQKLEKTGQTWSDISHSDKAYYIAYSVAGEMATKAVNLAGQYYKLNVPLTAGYIVHRNWGGCH